MAHKNKNQLFIIHRYHFKSGGVDVARKYY